MAPLAHPLRPALLALAAVLLGAALQRQNGFYDEVALAWLTAALVVTGLGTVGTGADRATIGATALVNLLTAGALAQFAALLLEAPAAHLRVPGPAELWPFQAGIVAAAALVVVGRLPVPVLARLWFPALLVLHAALGVWVLTLSPDPPIDVVTVHREALAALARGDNPYAITFPNIYGSDTGFYAPDMVEGDRVGFGFPYPPLSLLLAAPGALLAGDYRYANLGAMTIAAAAIGYCVRTPAAGLAASIFLFTPRAFFVLEQGWTEPLVVMLLAVAVFGAVRARPWLPLALGGLLVVKQYMALALPFAFFLSSESAWRPRLGMLRRAALVAAVCTAPFVVWDLAAFVRSVVTLQFYEPFREDSLSYLSLLQRRLGAPPPVWLGIPPVAAAAALVWWKGRWTPDGFAAGLGFVAFVAFAFGKKAFCNYYFFVIGALCVAAAALSAASASTATGGEQADRSPAEAA